MSDPTTIHNWHRMDARLTSSGQPTEAELAALAALGVRCVINLAPHSHAKALPDEAASVAVLGMTYGYMPVDFCAVMHDWADHPVHVYCAANYRVSAFLYRYRRDVPGHDATTARADLDRIWTPDAVWSAFITR